MAKKFVRGVTGVDDIESFDKTLTNVNDLISDGQNTYVHTKKGKVESYYNLTDNVKTVSSSNTDLIEVTSNNNTASLNPKHDAQKEQVLESTRGTVTIGHGKNGTSETSKVDTNPEKVLEHENLKTGDGLTVAKNRQTSTISLESTKKPDSTIASSLSTSIVYGTNFVECPEPNMVGGYITLKIADNKKIQIYMRESIMTTGLAVMMYRYVTNYNPSPWREMAIDLQTLQSSLELKQNTITNNNSIGLSGTGLRQLYTNKQTYSHANGILKTHVKSVSSNTSVTTAEDEFNFFVKINKGATSTTFTLNANDKTKFTNIINAYGQNNSVNISGCVFTLSGSSLTVTTSNNVDNNYVITFSDII